MKKSFVRFIGLIIAILMVVTMIPVTAFAEEATAETASAAFVVGDSTYYLMPDVTTTYNGKTYIGVYANAQ